MVDPERSGGTVVHWVAYGIPVSVTGFAEGKVSKPSDKYIGGKGNAGVGNYMGPCPGPEMPPKQKDCLEKKAQPQRLPAEFTCRKVSYANRWRPNVG